MSESDKGRVSQGDRVRAAEAEVTAGQFTVTSRLVGKARSGPSERDVFYSLVWWYGRRFWSYMASGNRIDVASGGRMHIGVG